MIKRDEIADPNSCLNRAADDEMIFVLRSKDVTFETVIKFWISERFRMGRNNPGDAQVQEAYSCARIGAAQHGR